MFDLVSTIALHSLTILLFAAALHFGFRRAVDAPSLVTALGVFAAYFLAVMLTMKVQSHLDFMDGLKFNWSGKILAICLTLGMMKLVPRASAAEMGLTLRQNSGSLKPSIIVTVALCIFAWSVIWLVGNKGEPTTERLLYQATLPGLDEELFFRGLLFALFLRAFPAPSAGAKSGYWPAAAAVTFLFAAGHAFMFNKGALMFDPLFLAFASLLGFGLLWIRHRTGSLLLPVLAHNIINFGNIFIPG